MCGILGGWRSELTSGYKNNIALAIDALKDRGPDDQGYQIMDHDQLGHVFLGHTRLSIIDLSQGGHQPMASDDGRYVLVFNGEIYNYKELRQELSQLGYVFLTQSDTEVLLKAWLHWKESCLTRLIGMFAFIIHDKQEKTLTCVRDAFGIKPFLYHVDEHSFLFASSQKALLSLRQTRPKANLQRCYDYLVYADYDSQEDSFIEGIKHLLPGHSMTFHLQSRTLSTPVLWWKPPLMEQSALSFKDEAAAIRELFLANVKLHLRSDVPIGVTLSGGIDSSSLVAAIRHLEPDMPIHTFSFIAQGFPISEEKWIDQINQHVNATPHKVFATQEELLKDIDDMILAQGEPFGSTSIYAQYRVFKLAKECGIKVTLDGQGADELLAGYHGYPAQRLASLFEQSQWVSAFKFMHQWAKWPDRGLKKAFFHAGSSLMPTNLQMHLRGIRPKAAWLDMALLEEAQINTDILHVTLSSEAKGRRVMEMLGFALQQKGLPELLRHGDRNSMRFSIESRVPFLTIPLIEKALSLPEHYLISPHGETKSIFREAMRGLVPDSILYRRDKIGFATPEKEWLKAMAPKARTWFKEMKSIPLLQIPPLLEQFDAIMTGQSAFSWQVWRWINFVRWYQQFID